MAKGKTFAPASTFTPGETNARAVRTAETTPTKRGARPSDTSPLPAAGDTAAAAAGDTATDQAAAGSEAAPRSTRKSAAKKQRVGKHRS